MLLSELESDGSITEAPAPYRSGPANFGTFGTFEHWFSGEFRAYLDGAKWSHAGGTIKASITASNCTPGYSSINVTLIRSVGGVITKTWPVTWGCGATRSYSWGTQDAGTYQLSFSRRGPVDLDENWKRVEGSVTYGT
jgi:hypothetical protein